MLLRRNASLLSLSQLFTLCPVSHYFQAGMCTSTLTEQNRCTFANYSLLQIAIRHLTVILLISDQVSNSYFVDSSTHPSKQLNPPI